MIIFFKSYQKITLAEPTDFSANSYAFVKFSIALIARHSSAPRLSLVPWQLPQ